MRDGHKKKPRYPVVDGSAVILARHVSGLTQRELADAAGVDRSTVQKAEGSGAMRPDVLKRLANALNKNVAELLSNDQDRYVLELHFDELTIEDADEIRSWIKSRFPERCTIIEIKEGSLIVHLVAHGEIAVAIDETLQTPEVTERFGYVRCDFKSTIAAHADVHSQYSIALFKTLRRCLMYAKDGFKTKEEREWIEILRVLTRSIETSWTFGDIPEMEWVPHDSLLWLASRLLNLIAASEALEPTNKSEAALLLQRESDDLFEELKSVTRVHTLEGLTSFVRWMREAVILRLEKRTPLAEFEKSRAAHFQLLVFTFSKATNEEWERYGLDDELRSLIIESRELWTRYMLRLGQESLAKEKDLGDDPELETLAADCLRLEGGIRKKLADSA